MGQMVYSNHIKYVKPSLLLFFMASTSALEVCVVFSYSSFYTRHRR